MSRQDDRLHYAHSISAPGAWSMGGACVLHSYAATQIGFIKSIQNDDNYGLVFAKGYTLVHL